jgi:hypothetical protein
MASYREMDAVGRDRPRFVLKAKQCLLLPVNDWERNFLNSLIHGNDMMSGSVPGRRKRYSTSATNMSCIRRCTAASASRPWSSGFTRHGSTSTKATRNGLRRFGIAEQHRFDAATLADCAAARSRSARSRATWT